MADAYVDLTQTASTATSPYDTWAKAAATIQVGLTQAGAGGRCFVRIDGDDVTPTKDTAAGSRTLQWPGTDQSPSVIYGVKNATTAAPPTDSDLCVRGTDTLPVYESTGGAITLDELTATSGTQLTAHGIRFDADTQIVIGGSISAYLYDCEIDFDSTFTMTTPCFTKLVNCDLIFFDTASEITGQATSRFVMEGGLLSGAAPTPLFDLQINSIFEFYGVDMSLVVGTLFDVGASSTGIIRIVNCKMGTGVTRITGIARAGESYIELIGSTDETALGTGESVRDYAKEYYKGTILSEVTFVRTGGANDGIASFSYALTPRASSTLESILYLDTPWFGGIVEGDATTSKDFTIYIANSSGADMTEADVWVEILYPSAAGVTQHDFDDSSRAIIDVSAATVTDDAASDWSTGAGGKNAQKIVITATPDYQGPVYARVMFAQAGTNTLYVDPKVYVTDT